MDSSTLTLKTGPFPVKGVSGKFILPWFTEIPVLNANSVDPDQTPRSVASDLGLHCFPVSILWDARLKWVKDSLQQQIRFNGNIFGNKCCHCIEGLL